MEGLKLGELRRRARAAGVAAALTAGSGQAPDSAAVRARPARGGKGPPAQRAYPTGRKSIQGLRNGVTLISV